MTTVDPERERQRLSELYAGMSDGELQEIGEELGSLSESAKQALSGEMARRGISLPAEPPPGDEIEVRDLVSIRQFRDLPEALLARGRLESSGIECFLGDDNMVRMDWFISNFVGGVKLKVKREDAEIAHSILNEPVPENFDVEGVGEYQQPRCPECKSVDISFEQLHKPLAYGSAWVGVPIPFQRKMWKCQECGHQWRDEEETD